MNDDFKIFLDSIFTGDNTHMPRQKELQIQLRKRKDAFFQQSAAAAGKVGAADILVENNIAAEQGFLLGPVKSDRAGGMAGSKDAFKFLIA